MVVIHEPDFGADFSHEGNMAKRVNGKARAKANANMPTAGANQLPVVVVCTSSMPMIGPVQENDTNTNVKAIRKMLTRPLVCDAFVSTLFAQLSGNLISNHPKKLQAKTTSNRNRNTLNTALVESAFKVSEPKIAVTKRPSPT